MAITPFLFKRFRSDLDISIIVQNISSNSYVQPQPAHAAARPRPKFEVKMNDNRFMLRRPAGKTGFGKISLLPVVHGRLIEEQDATRVHIFIRPFYTDIIALLAMCALQFYCMYSAISGGNYLIAGFAVLSVILAYAVVVIKFQAECRNYVTLIQKLI